MFSKKFLVFEEVQMLAFFVMTVFMFLLAIPYDHRTHKDNNISTVPFNLSWHICSFQQTWSDSGLVGAFGFLYLVQNKDNAKADAVIVQGIGVRDALIVIGVINFLGMLFTFLGPESKGKSLEEMSREDEGDNEVATEE